MFSLSVKVDLIYLILYNLIYKVLPTTITSVARIPINLVLKQVEPIKEKHAYKNIKDYVARQKKKSAT